MRNTKEFVHLRIFERWMWRNTYVIQPLVIVLNRQVIEQIKKSSEVSELFKKDNEALKLNNQALQHHIHQLEDELDQMRQENNVFHHSLQHFDSTAFLDFSTYRDDRPIKMWLNDWKKSNKSLSIIKCTLKFPTNCFIIPEKLGFF